MFHSKLNLNRDHSCLERSGERMAHLGVDSFVAQFARREWSLNESVIRRQFSFSANTFSITAFNWRL